MKEKQSPEHGRLDVFINPDVDEADNSCGFFTADDWKIGNSCDCSEWRDQGKSILRTGQDKTFRLGLYAPQPDLAFSFVANFCRAPELTHRVRDKQTPLDKQTMRNTSKDPVRSNGESTEVNGRTYYYYPLIKDAEVKNAGSYFVTLYARIEAGQGAGKVFACDPEMQVEERSGDDGGTN